MDATDFQYEWTGDDTVKFRAVDRLDVDDRGRPRVITFDGALEGILAMLEHGTFRIASPIEPPTENRPMWIEGAPTEPGNYWVMHTDHEPGRGEATKGPHIMEFLARGNGRLCAFVTGCEIEIEIWNYGPIGIASETAWIVAHQPIAEPEAYAP